MIQPFVLRRMYDASGISGTGTVAEGVVFSDGRCAMAWRPLEGTEHKGSVAFYDSIEELEAIHGHGGNTVVAFLTEITETYRKMVATLEQAATREATAEAPA